MFSFLVLIDWGFPLFWTIASSVSCQLSLSTRLHSYLRIQKNRQSHKQSIESKYLKIFSIHLFIEYHRWTLWFIHGWVWYLYRKSKQLNILATHLPYNPGIVVGRRIFWWDLCDSAAEFLYWSKSLWIKVQYDRFKPKWIKRSTLKI